MISWTGSLNIPGANDSPPKLLEIEVDASDSRCKTTWDCFTGLTFLSFVDRAQIPLHIIADRACEIHGNAIATRQWLEETLLASLEQEVSQERYFGSTTGCIESSLAALVRVDVSEQLSGSSQAHVQGSRITELLIYTSTSRPFATISNGVLTPPRSSSPTPDVSLQPSHDARTPLQARVWALPLSSDLLFNPTLYALPRSPLAEAPSVAQIRGQFLPPVDLDNPRKKQRLDSLFDGAAKQTKRAKRHAGETTARVMAGMSLPKSQSQSQSQHRVTGTNNQSGPKQPEMRVRKVPKPPVHSRCQSTNSVQGVAQEESRPRSQDASAVRAKGSALHRIASMSNLSGPRPTSSSSSVHVPSEMTSKSEEPTIQARNKNALSRIVMAGMRMYGFSRRKKPPLEDNTQDDDYKMVYHQTFKAASFALRYELDIELLDQEHMREVSDVLLALFCTNGHDIGAGLGEELSQNPANKRNTQDQVECN